MVGVTRTCHCPDHAPTASFTVSNCQPCVFRYAPTSSSLPERKATPITGMPWRDSLSTAGEVWRQIPHQEPQKYSTAVRFPPASASVVCRPCMVCSGKAAAPGGTFGARHQSRTRLTMMKVAAIARAWRKNLKRCLRVMCILFVFGYQDGRRCFSDGLNIQFPTTKSTVCASL